MATNGSGVVQPPVVYVTSFDGALSMPSVLYASTWKTYVVPDAVPVNVQVV
jgi:hypothetical protein